MNIFILIVVVAVGWFVLLGIWQLIAGLERVLSRWGRSNNTNYIVDNWSVGSFPTEPPKPPPTPEEKLAEAKQKREREEKLIEQSGLDEDWVNAAKTHSDRELGKTLKKVIDS